MIESQHKTIPNDLLKLHEEVQNFFEDLFDRRGLNPILGRLYAIFILSDVPMLQKELAERLNVSISTISRNLRTLEESGSWVQRTRVPGSREWQYSAKSTSFIETWFEQLSSALKLIQEQKTVLERLRAHWDNLDDKTRLSKEGQHTVGVLDDLVIWNSMLLEEYCNFAEKVTTRFLKIEEIKKILNRLDIVITSSQPPYTSNLKAFNFFPDTGRKEERIGEIFEKDVKKPVNIMEEFSNHLEGSKEPGKHISNPPLKDMRNLTQNFVEPNSGLRTLRDQIKALQEEHKKIKDHSKEQDKKLNKILRLLEKKQ